MLALGLIEFNLNGSMNVTLAPTPVVYTVSLLKCKADSAVEAPHVKDVDRILTSSKPMTAAVVPSVHVQLDLKASRVCLMCRFCCKESLWAHCRLQTSLG